MFKKSLTLFLFLFLSSCGYESIHSKKNTLKYDFSISKLNFIGDRNVNLVMKQRLNNYTLTKKDRNFTLKILSTVEKVVLAKDGSGDPTSFKSIVSIKVEILMKNKIKNTINIVESFSYNNNSNKFSLKRYENEIKNNLAETASEKLVFKLSNIQ